MKEAIIAGLLILIVVIIIVIIFIKKKDSFDMQGGWRNPISKQKMYCSNSFLKLEVSIAR